MNQVEQLLLELAPPPEPTLDNFHGGSNGPALAMLREALAGEPGQTERVFYLWGQIGRAHV